MSALTEDEAAAAAVHTAECQSCHQQFVEELRRQRGSVPFTFTLDPEFWFRDDHVDFDLLVELADKTLDQETEEIVNIHLKTCETCREDVRSFLAFREATAREMDISYARPKYQTTHEVQPAPWWHRLQSRPVYAVAAIVLVAVAILIGVIALNKGSGPIEARKQDQIIPGTQESPSLTSSPVPSVVLNPSSVDDATKVATFKDTGGEVTIDKNGRLTGLDQISENSRQYIARAALSQRIEPAEVLRRLSGEQSGLRGTDNGPQGFTLLYPTRTLVTDDRPVFRWESLPDVSSYRVYVLDADGEQVGQSQELPPTQTHWKAPERLRRGEIFSWVVTALVDGRKVVSPSASAPEMKFAVLSTADFQELTRLKKSNSHLALGVFYARVGLLDEAEREFERLIKLNPQSELLRKLLQSVRNTRQGINLRLSTDRRGSTEASLDENVYADSDDHSAKIFQATGRSVSFSRLQIASGNVKGLLHNDVMLCGIKRRLRVVLQQRRTDGFTVSFRILTPGFIALLSLATATAAQSVQTIDSETQLASVLCRNPKEEVTKERLDKNAHLVNVTLWKALLACASIQRQASPANSIEIYKLMLRIADRLNKPELVATTYYNLGRTYSLMSDLENSIQSYEASRRLLQQAGIESDLTYVVADLGALYFTAEDYEKARSYSEQCLAIAAQIKFSLTKESLGPIEYGQARSLHTLGETDLRQGNHEEAIKKLREALSLYEGLNGTGASYNTQISEVLVAQAKVHVEIGQYGQALSYLNKARQISKSSGDPNTFANVMNSLGSLLLDQEDYAAAQTFFNQSLAIYRSQGNARGEARVLLNLAVIKLRQGHHDDALQLFNRSMERAQATNLVDVQMDAGQGLGVVLTAKRDFSNALDAINQSLELARRVNAKTREAELLWRAAQTYYATQNYSESAAVAEQAVALARSLRLPKLTYLATAALGDAYAANNKLELAITTLKESIEQIEALRNRIAGRQEGRHLFFENKVGPYHTLVKLLAKQGENFEALLYAERAKTRVLVEAVRNNRVDLKDALTESERTEAERLISNLSLISEQIQSKPGSESRDQLKNQLEAARRELASFQERLAAAHPELQVRVGHPQPLTHAKLNTLIPANDFAYLEYVITGDEVGMFILKRKGATKDQDLKYVKLAVNADELRRKVHEFHFALAERHPDHSSLGRELYRLLIGPAANDLQNIRTVCIIPDGLLWTLPFQALTTKWGNYLIEEYSVYYTPSLSVLNEMALRRRQQSFNESLIAFGNPVIERNDELNRELHPIPETETEVTALAATARTRMKRVLVGRHADEKTFKALAPRYATIHLATHGLLDNRDPLNSYLLLTKTDGDKEADLENDGLLKAREIMNLRLNADLAVLSACETGNGRISPGEGVVGMSWAFFVAGARSMVVSQWQVNSASTSHLMKNFYQALARQNESDGLNKSHALREASLRLLKDRRYRHPFYWAGFVLVSSN